MRFERIFDDLEGQFAHHERQEMRAVSEDLTRAERAQLTLYDRLRGSDGAVLTLHLGTSTLVRGAVELVGDGWVVLREASRAGMLLVPVRRIALVEGLPGRARPGSTGEAVRELPLGALLRRIARDRATVRAETAAGTLVGRISTVGADAFDLQTIPTGESSAVPGSGRVTVVLDALTVMRIG